MSLLGLRLRLWVWCGRCSVSLFDSKKGGQLSRQPAPVVDSTSLVDAFGLAALNPVPLLLARRCSFPLWLQRTPWSDRSARFHIYVTGSTKCHAAPRPFQYARAPRPPAGLDLNNISELALSPDGKRLIVTNAAADDNKNVAVSDLSTPASNAPTQPLLISQHSASRVAVSPSSSYPSRVLLVRQRHMALLLRTHGGGGGDGDVDTTTAASITTKNVSCVVDPTNAHVRRYEVFASRRVESFARSAAPPVTKRVKTSLPRIPLSAGYRCVPFPLHWNRVQRRRRFPEREPRCRGMITT